MATTVTYADHRRLWSFIKFVFQAIVVCGALVAFYAYKLYSDATKDMPSVDKLLSAQERSTRIVDRNGVLIGELGNEIRIPISYGKMPKSVINALVASEDTTFWKNDGLYYKGIARAFLHNLGSHRGKQGASTITQQLVKLLIVGSEKSLARKIREAVLARQVKARYTNELILETYLNTVNFGFNRRGIEAAANFYFGKHAEELNDAEGAMLVGILPSPTNWSPIKNMKTALLKEARVLRRELDNHFIDPGAYEYAINHQPAIVPYKTEEARDGQEVIDEVRKFLEERYSKNEINHLGLTVWTTIDLKVQSAVKRALKDNNRYVYERNKRYYGFAPEGAAVVLDNERRIIALVGGANYAPGGQNRALGAWRQPGSTFKGLVYAAGFEAGKFGPGTIFSNIETEFTVPNAKSWTPKNYSEEESKIPSMSLSDAYAESLNRVAAKAICGLWPGSDMADAATVELDYCRKHGIVHQTIQLAERAGIVWNEKDKPQGNPSIALGSNGVTPMGMLNAYMSVSYDGRYVEPQLILRLEGENAPTPPPREEREVVGAQTVASMRAMMRAVIDHGTGRSARGKLPEIAGGKTGTTNNSTNAWFVGGTDSYWAVVWIGHKSQNLTLGPKETGAKAALPVWVVAMNAAYGRESAAVSAMRNQKIVEAPEPAEEPEVDEATVNDDGKVEAPVAQKAETVETAKTVLNDEAEAYEGSGTGMPDKGIGTGAQAPAPAPTPAPGVKPLPTDESELERYEGSGTTP